MADPNLERVYYFDGEFLVAQDFRAEQDYETRKLCDHNRYVHTWGIAAGLVVTAAAAPQATVQVARGRKKRLLAATEVVLPGVSAGLALDADGREIYYDGTSALPALPTTDGAYFLTIRYGESAPDEQTKRIVETPVFAYQPVDTAFDRSRALILARLVVAGGGIDPAAIGVDERRHCGLQAGHLRAASLAVAGLDAVFPATGTVTTSGTGVTGDGTAFLAEVHTGDQVQVAGETRTVAAVESETQLTVNTAWTTAAPAGTAMLVRPALLRVEDPATGQTGLFVSTEGLVAPGTSDTFALVVGGNVYAQNVQSVSDGRLKTGVEGIERPLEKVLGLRGVRFRWKAEAAGASHLGLIGQEVERAVPEAVSTDPRGYHSVDYAGLVGLLVEAVKEQARRLEAQEQALDTLRAAVARLQAGK